MEETSSNIPSSINNEQQLDLGTKEHDNLEELKQGNIFNNIYLFIIIFIELEKKKELLRAELEKLQGKLQ